MLSGTLAASLLASVSADKGTVRVDKGTIRAGQDF